jgi:hypothetical protein
MLGLEIYGCPHNPSIHAPACGRLLRPVIDLHPPDAQAGQHDHQRRQAEQVEAGPALWAGGLVPLVHLASGIYRRDVDHPVVAIHGEQDAPAADAAFSHPRPLFQRCR